MKRYFIVEEYFGIRVYDSKMKKEFYYDKNTAVQIKRMLDGEYKLISKSKENSISAPLKISMNLTKKCNLRCIQCFSDSGNLKDKELTTKDMYNLFDSMVENGTFFICLGGGEPFTRTDLFDILEYGKENQLAVSIVTNGLLLTKEIIERLNNLDVDYLWVSFEGMKDNHEKLRGKGTFDKTINALQLLKKYYKGRTALRMSINKYNIDEVDDLLKIAEKYDIDLVRYTPLLSFGRAVGKDLTIDQDEYIRFLDNMKKIKSNKVEIVYPNMPNNKFWIGTNGFGCHCGKEAVWIDEIGNYSPCIFWGIDFNIGNIKNNDYSELWEKSLQVSNIKGNEICKKCSNYKGCRGGCRARVLFELGNLDDVDPLCPLKKNLK